MLGTAPTLTHQRGCVLSTGKAFTGRRVAPCLRQQQRQQQQQTVCMSTVAAPASLEVKSLSGSAVGSEQLSLKVAEESARGLVHRYLVTVRQNARAGTACTKTRAEVRGGGAKPYAQKGTGNARRGSKRSPLIPGGGVSFGPKPRDWSIKMNKKERRLAMGTALQSAAGSIVVVEDLTGQFAQPKTKAMADALKLWGVAKDEYTLLITAEMDDNVWKSGRNMGRLQMNSITGLRVYDVLRADKIVIERSALKHIQEFYGGGSA